GRPHHSTRAGAHGAFPLLCLSPHPALQGELDADIGGLRHDPPAVGGARDIAGEGGYFALPPKSPFRRLVGLAPDCGVSISFVASTAGSFATAARSGWKLG